jgi:hypothetical protein|tara:strand:+ start:701 stop:1519 length:819 start_codon:yes stop_codon:yes gene_type:complete
MLIGALICIPAHAHELERMTDGKPNLNGVWQVMNSANYDLLAHASSSALATMPGPYGTVPAAEVLALGAVGAVPGGASVVDGNEIPYQPGARDRQQENKANWLQRDPEIKCYLPGVPRATYLPHPFQIFHSDNSLFFAYAFAGATRNIYLEDPGEAPADSWMGQSYGWWEDDTLVVEVTSQNDRTWFDRSGNYHSDALKVTERYTPKGPNVLLYEATIEDASVYTRPWTIRMPLYRRVGADAELYQFKCMEFVEELMYGHLRKEPLREFEDD